LQFLLAEDHVEVVKAVAVDEIEKRENDGDQVALESRVSSISLNYIPLLYCLYACFVAMKTARLMIDELGG
jgi:hypothetical protein